MTDNDIIKALEACTDPNAKCSDCPFHNTMYDFCRTNSQTMALMLINRQKAEIERLTARNFELSEKGEKVCIAYKTARAEAIKEFAERLQIHVIPQLADGYTREIVLKSSIDNLVKEMVGERE